MMEKYSLLPINSQQLTPAQTALQRMSEKHLNFEIQTVNTIRPPDIKYTQKSQPLVPVDTPLLIIRKNIPRLSDIDKIVKGIETCVIHGEQSLFLFGYRSLFGLVVVCCCFCFYFGCGGYGTVALENVVRVYPETIQGLTFYRSKIYITKILACVASAKSLLWSPRLVTSMK